MTETQRVEPAGAVTGAQTLSHYRRRWLRSDVIAGLTVTALLVPEGMAYAQIAGVPPETAFYAAPAGLVLYALLGTSRQVVVAVSAAVAATSASIVGDMTEGGTEEFIALTSALAVVAGLVMFLAGLLKLGRVSEFFSESVLKGFVFGLAIVIAVRQLPKLFGLEAEEGNVFERLWHLFGDLGDTHGPTLLVGLTSLGVMLAIEHLVPRLPAALVTLVYGIVLSAALGLEDDGVHVVGEIPAGLVGPRVPDFSAAQLDNLLLGGLGLGLLVFAEAVGPARQFADRHGYEVASDRELIGSGAANIGAGMFQGFPIGASLSKSAANDRAGAQTSLSLIVAAILTILVALFATPLFEPLPEATLGAIVIVAVSGMIDIAALKRLYRLRPMDLGLSVLALTAVLIVETLPALLIAVFASLMLVLIRVSTPTVSVLGRVPGHLALVDVKRHGEAQTIPSIVVARPNAELFFANISRVREALTEAVQDPRTITLLIDLEMTADLDAPTVDGLFELCETLHERGIAVNLARVHGDARAMLDRGGVTAAIGADNIHERVLDGVQRHLHAHHEAMTDRMRSSSRLAEVIDELGSLTGDDPGVAQRRAELRTEFTRLSNQLTTYTGD